MSITPASGSKPAAGVRFRAWLRKHDRITVTIGEWPAANPIITVKVMGFWRWLVFLATVLTSIGIVVAAWRSTTDAVYLIPVLALIVIGVLSIGGPASHEWTDHVVAPAIAELAKDLGTEVSHNVWRLDTSRVGDLAANLVQLANLDKARDLGDTRTADLDHERSMIGLAGPILLPYLRPRLTATEHHNEPLGLADAEPPTSDAWPTLPSPDEDWKQPRNR